MGGEEVGREVRRWGSGESGEVGWGGEEVGREVGREVRRWGSGESGEVGRWGGGEVGSG